MDDIAKQLNISKATVSYVLNNKAEGISAQTIDRVHKLVEKLNYSPSVSAQRLTTKKSMTLAYIVPYLEFSLADTYYGQILGGLCHAAKNLNYQIIVEGLDPGFIEKNIYLKMFNNNTVDGFLIAGIEVQHKKHIVEMIKNKIPFVFINSILENVKAFYIVGDNYDIGYRATNYLIQKGHKKIAHILGDLKHYSAKERLDGYKKALLDNKIKFNPDYIIEGFYLRKPASINFKNFLSKKYPVTAVFCANDSSAMGVYDILKENKINIPDEISIIGVDNNPLYWEVSPHLTTVTQPIFEMAEQACEKLIHYINGEIKQIHIKKSVAILEKDSVKQLTARK